MLIPHQFSALKHAASKDKSREALQCLRFWQSNDTLNGEATDGRVLLRAAVNRMPDTDFPMADEEDGIKDTAIFVLPDTFERPATFAKKQRGFPVLRNVYVKKPVGGEKILLTASDLEREVKEEIALPIVNYPQTDAIFPKPDAKFHHTVAIGLLTLESLCATVRGLCADKRNHNVAITFHFPKSPLNAVKVDASNEAFCSEDKVVLTGMLMPIKG